MSMELLPERNITRQEEFKEVLDFLRTKKILVKKISKYGFVVKLRLHVYPILYKCELVYPKNKYWCMTGFLWKLTAITNSDAAVLINLDAFYTLNFNVY